MKILFNYTDIKFYKSQKLNTKTGYQIGSFDFIHEFNKKDILIKCLLGKPNMGVIYMNESLNQYPPIDIDEKSTYPNILLDLHKKTN